MAKWSDLIAVIISTDSTSSVNRYRLTNNLGIFVLAVIFVAKWNACQ